VVNILDANRKAYQMTVTMTDLWRHGITMCLCGSL